MDEKMRFIIENFSEDFDIDILFNRKRRHPTLEKFGADIYSDIRNIKTYPSYMAKKENSSFKFEEASDLAKKLVNTPSELGCLIRNREVLRNAYTAHCAFDNLVRDHPLVNRAISYLEKATKNDPLQMAILLTPGKNYAREGTFNLVAHIEKTYLIARLSRRNRKIEEVCQFLQTIVYAEGVLDWSLSDLKFYYDFYGLTFLRELKKRNLFSTNNPLMWIHKDFNQLINLTKLPENEPNKN